MPLPHRVCTLRAADVAETGADGPLQFQSAFNSATNAVALFCQSSRVIEGYDE